MVTQLKSYLLQSAELQAMLEPQHQYPQDKLGKSLSSAPVPSGHRCINCTIWLLPVINQQLVQTYVCDLCLVFDGCVKRSSAHR